MVKRRAFHFGIGRRGREASLQSPLGVCVNARLILGSYPLLFRRNRHETACILPAFLKLRPWFASIVRLPDDLHDRLHRFRICGSLGRDNHRLFAVRNLDVLAGDLDRDLVFARTAFPFKACALRQAIGDLLIAFRRNPAIRKAKKSFLLRLREFRSGLCKLFGFELRRLRRVVVRLRTH